MTATIPSAGARSGEEAGARRGRHGDSEARFLADVATHEMTVLHDDGVYRHIRFRRPDGGFYWFDLVTWPGHLSITGDYGSFTWARVTDMLPFFATGQEINPGYWAEKVVAGQRDIEAYSADRLAALVAEEWREHADEHGWVLTSIAQCWAQIVEEVLDYAEYEADAYAALRDFRYEDGEPRFSFRDTWEWPLTDYTHRYLWCCHAVRWGARQYLRRAASMATAPLTGPVVTLPPQSHFL